jgi:hypothetical protein
MAWFSALRARLQLFETRLGGASTLATCYLKGIEAKAISKGTTARIRVENGPPA